ncbi:MAG: RNA-dependent ATPase rok1 [Caeruleum heppii]|nr:MAG: RNA-dependent ATPase rok1 [Caeruleum heppii]
MDPFRILTRSTKLGRKNSASNDPANVQHPSNGHTPNPQLFGATSKQESPRTSPSDTSGTKKRKRGRTAPDSVLEIPTELDFFANHKTKNKARIETSPSTALIGSTEDPLRSTEETTKLDQSQVDLDVADSKRILHAHKVRVTRLLASPTEKNKIKKKGKSSGPGKEHKLSSKTGGKHAEQIYPQPLTSFEQLRSRYHISKTLAQNVRQQGYTVPTEVQLGALPLLLGSNTLSSLKTGQDARRNGTQDNDPEIDLLAVAPTGSGKTLAFLIAVLNGLLRERQKKDNGDTKGGSIVHAGHGVQAIIVAPTKELAAQIVNEGRKLAKGTGIRVSGMRKGMRILEDLEHDLAPAENTESQSESDDADDTAPSHTSGTLVKSDVLVSTPLMLLNAIKATDGSSRELLTVKYLVLDEADVLLDPLFRVQTLGIWNACVHPALQVSLWSATMGSNIEELTMSTTSARRQTLRLSTPYNLLRLVVGIKDSAVPNISHRLTYAATEAGKLLALRQLLHPTSTSSDTTPPLRAPFLIFTQTIPRAIALHSELLYDIPLEAGGPSRLAVLHSDLTDTARDGVMSRFRAGEIWILITTDLLARGVDFRGINGVVNYDVPNSAAAYIHRVGRTGRAGRNGGVAVTLYTKEDVPYVRGIANVIARSEALARSGGKGQPHGADHLVTEKPTIQKWLLDALPKPTKSAKKQLKRFGVEARRPPPKDLPSTADNKEAVERARRREREMRISTKSGFDRRVEHRRKGLGRGMGKGGGEGEGVGEGAVGMKGGVDQAEEWGGIAE